MTTQLVYAETSIWNELCSQAINPEKVASRLAKRGEKLVLGMNVFFEMVKTFGMQGAGAANRGSQLFSYLNMWIKDDFQIVRQTPEILVEEALSSLGGSRRIRLFLEGLEHKLIREEITKLASGEFGSPRDEFIRVRKATAKQAREEMENVFRALPEIKSRLKKIPKELLKDWLTEEVQSERGVEFLARQLDGVMPVQGKPFPKLREIAENLLASTEYRVSNALVRNGIYLNWRLAHRGSVETSSFDDAYHVVNASYCNKFLTTDSDQAEQASYSLVGSEIGYCEPGQPLDLWLADNGYEGRPPMPPASCSQNASSKSTILIPFHFHAPRRQSRLEVVPKQDISPDQFRIAFCKNSLLLCDHKIVGRLNQEFSMVRPTMFN
jgi:hypothetical protein